MGEHLRNRDWSQHALGPLAAWPRTLKAVLRTVLDSPQPMWLLWGPAFFANDAYLRMLGGGREGFIGARGDEVFASLGRDIAPRVHRAIAAGAALREERVLILVPREGFVEEAYHTFSFGPVCDEDAAVAGLLCVVTDETERVLAERRRAVLRALDASSGRASRTETAESVCQHAVEELARCARDIPWIAILLIDVDRAQAVAIAGTTPSALGLEMPVALSDARAARWRLEEVVNEAETILIEDPIRTSSPDETSIARACVLPVVVPTRRGVAGVVLAGLSPNRRFDAEYRGFLEQAARALGDNLAATRVPSEEQRRDAIRAEFHRANVRFFSSVGHEFRTHLALISAPIEDTLRDERTPAVLRPRLELARGAAWRLSKVAETMLDFSRVKAGRLHTSFEPTDLASLTRAIAGAFEVPMRRAGLAYTIECDTLDELVFVDRESWEKVVLHLLSNALKFTRQGAVTVRLRRDEHDALLEVIDTGAGIAPAEQPHLFESFHRIDNPQARSLEGSGIGLALVRALVRLHGGAVGFQSEPGRGSTFKVRVPFGSGHLPVERVSTTVSRIEPPLLARAFVEESLRWLHDTTGEAPPTVSVETSVNDLRFERTFGSHILIADDDADMRRYLRDLLAGSYVVDVVADGEAALEVARRRSPDLILSTLLMPRLGGLGLLRAVRSDEKLRRIPLVMFSGRAEEEARAQALDAGADDYLLKPFSSRELLARIGALLERRQLRAGDEQRMKVALAAANMVTWEWELASNRIQLSHNAPEVLGADWTDRTYLRSIIHPEDWAPHQKAVREALRTRGSLRSEIRLRRPDNGQLRWYEVRGQVETDSSGEPRAIHGATIDVTERKRTEEALRDMDRRKDEFLAMLAHELRNPLAPIQTGSELLERNFQADDSVHGIAAMVKRQVAQLARLVDDLLDVSRITQGRIELKRDPVDLGEVVQRVVESMMPLLREKQQQFESVPSLTPLYVRGDLTRLVQALANLLANAIKYTDRGGHIRLEVRRDRGHALIEVRDDGIGISADLLPRVFELFVQGDSGLDRAQGGLGIGLSVVRRLVEMHGGSVTAASEGERQGATFQIRLPLIAEPLHPVARMAPSILPAEPRRVLVIDDNIDAADTLCMLLRVAGHSAEAVYGGREALQRLGEFAAEAALVDIGLPDMSGYDLARQIRARSGRIQLIALTGYGQPEDFVRSREAGFDAHMIKPVALNAVEAVLARGRALN